MADEVTDNHLEYISENYPTTLLRAVYVRNYTRIKEVLRPFKITPSQWRVLANLNEYDGQNVNSLAERSYTDRTNLSRSVAVMESEGLVVRRRENKDQRNILVFLTEKGHTKFTDVLPSVLEDIDFVLEGLSDNAKVNDANQSYVETADNLESTLSDIRIASMHVEKTVDSAILYLNTTSKKKSYQKEITNLEQALIASRMALQVFEDALIKTSGNTNFDEFVVYNDLVDRLRDVTNSFSNRAETN